MKNTLIRLSFPSDLVTLLRFRIPKRNISKYVVEAVKKNLEKDERKELLNLEAAYEAASKDPDRKKAIREWADLE